tara:strand:+ start:385 stop:678 length:294 start_codon:yes stop_codon:yes gene_type:complete
MKEYILKQSPRKYKRFRIIFDDGKFVDFGADGAKTFVDGRTEKEREAWIARHKDDKYYNDKRSGIYHSRMLLWTKPKLREAIKEYEKIHDVKIKLIK